MVSPDDRFKFIDDLSFLQLVCLSGLVTEYDFFNHVASDVGIDEVYLAAEKYPTQSVLNSM